MGFAILLHLANWNYKEDQFELEKGVSLNKTNGTEIEKIYKDICKNWNVDSGEPFNYRTHLLFTKKEYSDGHFENFASHQSLFSHVCNFITICNTRPLGMCRLLTGIERNNENADFKKYHSELLFEHTTAQSALITYPDIKMENKGSIILSSQEVMEMNSQILNKIKNSLGNYNQAIDSEYLNNHRIQNALDYFFYSWNSFYLEHTCINLAIVLETLFAPKNPRELTHQIAFNVSHFYGQSVKEKEDIYKKVKKFYNLRSKIIHGEVPEHKELYLRVPSMFNFCAKILQRILSDTKNILEFGNESDRDKQLKKWMFGA